MDGIILINKPQGFTSRDVVNKLGKIYQTKKIGHTGTLDPMATGVLVCCIGKYTKLVDLLTCYNKEYIAEITLGIKTDTADITGNILEKEKPLVNFAEIKKVFLEFPKEYLQTVPKYSAVKINGKKLYEYARCNIKIELPKRKVNIYSLELLDFKDNKILFKTSVSKGTYIRSLIEDICLKLNTIGTMSSLERTKQGNFDIAECFNLDEVTSKTPLLKIEDIFDYPTYEVDEDTAFKIKNGAKIPNVYNITDKVIFKSNNSCIAIYENENNILKSYFQC